jgi:hypothetical protein
MGLARARDHRSTYVRRNELARERGFRNYADQRKQFRQASTSNAWRGEKPKANRPLDIDKVKTFHNAFEVPENADDYSVDGPKAKWFIEVVGTMTREEWIEHYPTGLRYEIHRSTAV